VFPGVGRLVDATPVCKAVAARRHVDGVRRAGVERKGGDEAADVSGERVARRTGSGTTDAHECGRPDEHEKERNRSDPSPPSLPCLLGQRLQISGALVEVAIRRDTCHGLLLPERMKLSFLAS